MGASKVVKSSNMDLESVECCPFSVGECIYVWLHACPGEAGIVPVEVIWCIPTIACVGTNTFVLSSLANGELGTNGHLGVDGADEAGESKAPGVLLLL